MREYTCKNCGCTIDSYVIREDVVHTGLYCNYCDAWYKWLGKKELAEIVEDMLGCDHPHLEGSWAKKRWTCTKCGHVIKPNEPMYCEHAGSDKCCF